MRNIHYFLKRIALTAIVGCLPLFAFGQTEISTEAGLRAIAGDLSGNYKLTADITLTEEWTPLGTFKGTLDGDGHIISGLFINASNIDRTGLFSITQGATIRNLGFENVYIIGHNDAAAIAGQMQGGLLEKCYVANSHIEGNDHVASFTGRLSDGAVVQDSYANAHIYSYSTQAGGLIGVILHNNTKVSKCYFSGIVRSVNARPAGIVSLVDAGGATIEYCVNLAPYILGPSNLRIVSVNNQAITLTRNYSLASNILGGNKDSYSGNVITNWGDTNFGASKGHGDNIGALYDNRDDFSYDAEAKKEDLYKNKLEWDFDNTWKITEGSYPVLKWQTGTVKTSTVKIPMAYGLKSGASLDLAQLRSTHGLTGLSFTTNDPNLTVDGTTITAGTITAALGFATVQVSASPVAGFQLQEEIKIALFPGDDTEIPIATQEKLDEIRYNPSGKYKLTDDIELTGLWSSIPSFTGTFDGDGHIISGLKIIYLGEQQGLFGTTNGATIRGLGIENAYIEAGNRSAPMIGLMTGGLLEESYASDSKVLARGDHNGGLVGRLNGGAIVQDCYSTVYVSAPSNNQAGGIAGNMMDNGTKIFRSYFAGIVESGRRPNGIASGWDNNGPTIEKSVNLAPYLLHREASIGTWQCRIVASDNTGTLIDNYSLESTKLGTTMANAVVLPGDKVTGTTTRYGENITAAQAKTAAFYSGIGWDMNDKWQVLGDGYPVLKWQTAPVNTSVLNLASPYSLASDATLDLSPLLSSHGVELSFVPQDDAISISTEKIVSATSGAFPPAGVTVDVVPANTDFRVRESLVINIFPVGIIDIDNVEKFLLLSLYPEMNYRLTADLDLSEVTTFHGIGTAEKPFKGTFDGNGHIISGATVEDKETRNIGLFRVTEGATIKRLGVENARFIGNEDVGGIVGKTTGVTTIEECYVSNSYIEGRDHAGAITGGLNDGSIIRNSYATARVHSREYQAGGLTGTLKKGLIENCYYSGVVTNVGGRSVGVGGYHDEAGNTDPKNNWIRNSVNLAPYILGSDLNAVYRIFDNNGRTMKLENNWSISTAVVGKPGLIDTRTIPDTDTNYGLENRHGANVSPADAKTRDFYETTLEWDFSDETGVWKILDGAYPVLKWQDTPVANSIFIVKDQYVLKADETLDLATYAVSSHGLGLTFASVEGKLSVTGSTASINGTVAAWDKDSLTVAKTADASFAAATGDKLSFTLFPEAIVPIADFEQLEIVRTGTDGSYILTADLELEVEGTTTNWTPIASFSGTFDGNGHTITGLTYNDPSTHNIGFFSQTKGATIKKLGLINAYFIGNENIGGFVGTAENTTIQECFVEGSYIEARDRAGAIAGRIMYGTTIENSYAATSELKAREQQVGGLVGASMESDTPIRLSNTYFDGTVIGGTNRACGILGLVDRAVDITIENSVNLATEITGGADGRRYRIAHWGDDDIKARTLLDNNYSLAATIVGEDPIATDNENYGADKWHGANIPEGDGNAKTQAFYETTLGWDFDSAWLMLDDGNAYPVLSAFYSGDATLSALSVDESDLSPAFDAATTEYTLEVENAIENVTVHATPNQEGAAIAIDGDANLIVGENTVTVTVTAENRTSQVYTITVTRKDREVGIAGVNVPDVTVTTTQGRILAQFEGDAPVRLYSVTGQLIDETVAVNSYEQSVKQGVYILSIQNKAYKVVVK